MHKKTVAQGTFYLFISQSFFLISAYGLHAFLGRSLGPNDYGLFGFVISILVWLEIVLGGVSGAATKKIAESPVLGRIIEKKAVHIQFFIAIAMFILAFLSSPLLSQIFNDPEVNLSFKIAILDILIIGFYLIYSALLNGLRFYKERAIALIIYSISKLLFSTGLVLLGFSVKGALVGNIMASGSGFVVSFYYFKKITGKRRLENEKKDSLKSLSLFKLAILFTVVTLLFSLLMNIDLWFVKGVILSAPKVGYYVAAGTLAKAIYFLFTALSIALFPAITDSIAEGRVEQTKRYINQALRFLFMFLIPISLVMATTSGRFVSLLYSSSYLPASPSLSILAFGYAFISILLAIVYILMANNSFKEVMILALFLVLIDIGLCIALIPHYGLNGAALATAITGLIGVLLGANLLWQKFSTTLVAPISFLKILAASLLATLIFIAIPSQGIYLIVLYIFGASAYLGILAFLKEIKKEDILVLKQLIKGS